MKLTTPILKLVTHQISCGNPLWGLAVANEYLTPSDPLHRALAFNVRRRLKTAPEHGSVFTMLAEGARRKDLPDDLAQAIGAREGARLIDFEHLPISCALHHQQRRLHCSAKQPLRCRAHLSLAARSPVKRRSSLPHQGASPLNLSL